MAFRESLRLKVPLSIVGLNTDCLFQIFSHLQLLDLLNFRLVCTTLNKTVCEYLPQIATLSIFYTEHDRRELEKIPPKRIRRQNPPKKSWLEDTIEDFPHGHFRSTDFIVIFGQKKFFNFIEFIKKYEVKNIKKLALIIDPKPSDFPMISKATALLELCPKIEKLFLDRTNREPSKWLESGGWNFVAGVRKKHFDKYSDVYFKADYLDRLFGAIVGLTSLGELHFFARSESKINLLSFYECDEESLEEDEAYAMIGHFLWTMVRKLRAFSYNHFICYEFSMRAYETFIPKQSFDHILKLGLLSKDFVRIAKSETTFMNLHSLTLFGVFATSHFEKIGNYLKSFKQLKTLRFCSRLTLGRDVMLKLKALPNLEKLAAHEFEADTHKYDGKIDSSWINRTIKYIELKKVDKWPEGTLRSDIVNYVHKYPDHRRCYAFTDFFQVLETVSVSAPDVEKKVYEVGNFNTLRIED